jgi:uncharacterized membrane protein
VLIGFLLTLFLAGTSVSVSRTARPATSPNGYTVITDGTHTAVVDNVTMGQIQQAVAENEFAIAMQDPAFRSMFITTLAAVGTAVSLICLVSSCLRLLVFNPLEVGCRSFFNRNTKAPAEMDEVKTGFHPYGRNVGAMLLRDLFIFLWSLLFIIPGLIKHYSYRMVPYILAEDPSIGAKDAITLSRQMMDGHKWNTFVLDLSFIGWDLLSALTLGLLGVFYVNPYKYSTGAELYQVLKNQ